MKGLAELSEHSHTAEGWLNRLFLISLLLCVVEWVYVLWSCDIFQHQTLFSYGLFREREKGVQNFSDIKVMQGEINSVPHGIESMSLVKGLTCSESGV